VFQSFAIADLLPTQVTVGMREVAIKRLRWRNRSAAGVDRYLNARRGRIVLGPENRHYIIDRHHHARSLYEEGVVEMPVEIVGDYSRLAPPAFWTELEQRNWTHPFDAAGVRCGPADIPRHVRDLADDPYRSLAGALKRAGGFAKDKSPFSEFRWADFLRDRIDRKTVDQDFEGALALAARLAHRVDTIHLPGWRGPYRKN